MCSCGSSLLGMLYVSELGISTEELIVSDSGHGCCLAGVLRVQLYFVIVTICDFEVKVLQRQEANAFTKILEAYI